MEEATEGKSNSYIYFTIIISLLISAAVIVLLFMEIKKPVRKDEAIRESVSMSEEAAARAYIWLNRIEDMPFSYAEIKEMMGDLHLDVILTPAGEEGKYVRTLEEGTVETCEKQARMGLEKAYRETIRYRFQAAGLEEELTDDMLDEMMREAYELSVPEYLDFCDVQLLPTPEELTEMYSGEVAHE